MRELFATLDRIAPTPLTVLAQGETGTGKEELARAIHACSPRATGPLVVLDAANIPATLAESVLFGHERGAFTGADARHVGAFERAHGGTLFLDEVGELALDLQPKLLRVLETRSLTRVGGTETIPIDIRLVAATHRDLRAEIDARRFREDLFYRLAEARVFLPPARTARRHPPARAALPRRAGHARAPPLDDAGGDREPDAPPLAGQRARAAQRPRPRRRPLRRRR